MTGGKEVKERECESEGRVILGRGRERKNSRMARKALDHDSYPGPDSSLSSLMKA